MKISKILDLNKSEQIQGFDQNVSSFKPHDPLFGYHNEFFQSSLSLGSVDKIDENGFYNYRGQSFDDVARLKGQPGTGAYFTNAIAKSKTERIE